MIIVNFKTYESAIGQKALELAKIHEKVAQETGVQIIVAVQPADIYPVQLNFQQPDRRSMSD